MQLDYYYGLWHNLQQAVSLRFTRDPKPVIKWQGRDEDGKVS